MEVRKTFHHELEELYLELLKMANATVESIDRTREAFATMDTELTGRIIDGDDEIDALLVRIEEGCVKLLARQAPVAIDLRTIIVIMWHAQHLERIADLCVNICKAIYNIRGYRLTPWMKENILEMFDSSRDILVRSIEAFKKRDAAIAAELSEMDEAVDRINRAFLTRYRDVREGEMDMVIRVVMIARFLERIADHAVDIGENVRYMVTGEIAD